jgi:protein SCO1/2
MSENDPQDPANTGGGADYRSDRRSIMGLNTTFLVGGIALLVAGIAAAILLLNSGQDPASFNGNVLQHPIQTTDFTFKDQRGDTFSLSDARGKVVVLTFLYTYCTDVCPLLGAKLHAALQQLGEDITDVRFVGITVDPDRDTSERIQLFSYALGLADYAQWHYLVGTEAELQPIWQAYYINPQIAGEAEEFHEIDELESWGLLNGLDQFSIAKADAVRHELGGGYEVSHSTPVWLIDRSGQVRVEIGAGLDPSELTHDIRLLLQD